MILKNNKRIDGCSDTVPIGTLNPFLGSTAPYGYLICEGQRVSKTTYKELYEICGDTFGQSTATEFYLPDLRGQTIAGYKEGDSTFGTLGGLIGSLTHTHTYAHTHGVPGVAHTHSYAHTHGVPGVAHTHTSAAHTHSINGHTHSTGNHTLTIAELPAHNHTFAFNFYNYQQNGYGYNGQVYKTSSSLQTGNVTTNNTGSNAAHNHGNTGSTSLTTNSTTPGATGSTTPSATTTNSQSTSTSGSTTPSSTTTNSQSTTNTSSVSNVQPTMALNWIVKAFQLMPNQSYVENSLESDSTINSLSAAKGKELNKKFTDYATKSEMIQYLPLNGGTMKGEIITGQGDGYGIQLGVNGRVNATLDGKTNATVLGILDASVIVGHTSSPLLLRGSDNTPRYNGVALVESGNNSNGSYIKLIDGTMICYHTKSINIACTSQWGQLYEGGAAIGNLPATFISTPIVMVTNTAPDGYFEGIQDTTTSTWGTLRMAIPTSSTRTFKVNLLAIGRWK